MKITKAVRDGMLFRLNEKIEEANNKERHGYDERRKECIVKIEEWFNDAYHECENILRQYGMGVSDDDPVVSFFPHRVKNRNVENEFYQHDLERRRKRDASMRDIEFECALGTDKEAFLAMLDAVTFE